jgi:hypothetical protein
MLRHPFVSITISGEVAYQIGLMTASNGNGYRFLTFAVWKQDGSSDLGVFNYEEAYWHGNLWRREAFAISRERHTHDIDQFVKRGSA